MFHDIFSLGKQYLTELAIWLKNGKPIRDPEDMLRIYSICEACPNFNAKDKKCGICGCYLDPSSKSYNKIAWATTSCPDNPPRWESDINSKEPDNKDIEIAKQFINNENKKEARTVKHSSPPKGCGCNKR